MALPLILSFLYSQLFVKLPYPTSSFTGQTIIVTGSNTGLGFEAAKHFVRLNAQLVIIAVRTLSKGETAKASILASLPHVKRSTILVWELDLSSFESVKAFVEKVQGLERLDVIVENAGIGTEIWKQTEGMESTITTNVLSTELLAMLLLPKLRETSVKFNVVPRISIVSSDLHFFAKFEERKGDDIFATLNKKEGANLKDRYGVSKLMEVFFVRELADKIYKANKPKIIVNCMTPGACKSDFFRELSPTQTAIMDLVKFLLARTTEVGSRTLVAGASAGEESQGEYMKDCHVTSPSAFVLSPEGEALQKRLWKETMVYLEKFYPGIEEII